jgi:hypothetical protein
LDCGDGVFGVAALGRGGHVGGELRDLERYYQSQSGDFADSVTAVQNLAADSKVHGRESESEREILCNLSRFFLR